MDAPPRPSRSGRGQLAAAALCAHACAWALSSGAAAQEDRFAGWRWREHGIERQAFDAPCRAALATVIPPEEIAPEGSTTLIAFAVGAYRVCAQEEAPENPRVGVAILYRGRVVHADAPPNPQCYRATYRFADLDASPPLDLVVRGSGGCGSGIDHDRVEGYRLTPRGLARLFTETLVAEDRDGRVRLTFCARSSAGEDASFNLHETPDGAEWSVLRFPCVVLAPGTAVERRECALRRGRARCTVEREPGVITRPPESDHGRTERLRRYRAFLALEPALRRVRLSIAPDVRAEIERSFRR